MSRSKAMHRPLIVKLLLALLSLPVVLGLAACDGWTPVQCDPGSAICHLP